MYEHRGTHWRIKKKNYHAKPQVNSGLRFPSGGGMTAGSCGEGDRKAAPGTLHAHTLVCGAGWGGVRI